MMKTVVECSNCGGGGTELQFWIAVAGLAIAIVALGMTYGQFRQFLAELRARAEFEVTLRQVFCDSDGVTRTGGEKCTPRVAVWIKNKGKKAAGETVINAVVPRGLTGLRWCGPNGETMDEDRLVAYTDEMLTEPDGTNHKSQYLVRTLPILGLKPNNLGHFEFDVNVPEPGEKVIPIRVVVLADEIPDEVDAYSADLDVRVERNPTCSTVAAAPAS